MKDGNMKSKDDSRAKYKAISDCLSDYSGFKLIENGTVKSVENDCCMTCHIAFAGFSLFFVLYFVLSVFLT